MEKATPVAGNYPRQTKEVRVAVRAAFRAVDLVQVLQRKLELGCQTLYSIPQVTSRQGRELVEHRLDDSRVDNHHDELECDPTADTLGMMPKNDVKDTYMNAMSQGTNRSPAHLKMYRKAAKKGEPRTKASPHPLMRSMTNRLGVVLLNPCFSSSTNVL